MAQSCTKIYRDRTATTYVTRKLHSHRIRDVNDSCTNYVAYVRNSVFRDRTLVCEFKEVNKANETLSVAPHCVVHLFEDAHFNDIANCDIHRLRLPAVPHSWHRASRHQTSRAWGQCSRCRPRSNVLSGVSAVAGIWWFGAVRLSAIPSWQTLDM